MLFGKGRQEKQWRLDGQGKQNLEEGFTCSQLPFQFLQSIGNDLIQSFYRPFIKMS